MMHALARVAAAGRRPPCEVIFAGAADEEYSYRGVVKLCEGLRADAAVVSEPTSLRLVVATKGCVRFRVCVRGKAAHSSKPWLGVNAVSNMARVVTAVEEDARSLDGTGHPLLGSATFNIGIIRGGTQINIVPDSCAIEIDRRLLPGEEPDEVLGLLPAVGGTSARSDPAVGRCGGETFTPGPASRNLPVSAGRSSCFPSARRSRSQSRAGRSAIRKRCEQACPCGSTQCRFRPREHRPGAHGKRVRRMR